MLAMELTGLTKVFAGRTVVDGVDLAVPAGAMFGLVGPNGAGKTTLLSMAVGLLRPTGGQAQIVGRDVWAEPALAKAAVGVLPSDLALPEPLSGREILTYLGALHGLDRAAAADRGTELLSLLGLAAAGEEPVGQYSTGMRKKLGLATALLHAPRVLVLDEPLEAVDPVSSMTIRTILERHVASGGSVIVSSHVMALVEELCDHVAVMMDGRVIAAGTTDEVREGRTLEQAFARLVGVAALPAEGLSWLMP